MAGVFTEFYVRLAAGATELLGHDYQEYGELSQKGMNFFRFLVWCVAPSLAWIYRHEITARKDQTTGLFVNLAILGWCFSFVALFVSANMFGRMARYFDPFVHVLLVTLFINYVPREKRGFNIAVCLLGFSIYFVVDLYLSDFVYRSILT